MNKIFIIFEEPEEKSGPDLQDDYNSEDADDSPAVAEPTVDYHELTDRLFFRVFQSPQRNDNEQDSGADDVFEERLIFDQLDMNSRIDPETGKPMMAIGDAIVAIN